jgi:hypothetical protein
MLPRKNDVIIAMHALQRLLGDELSSPNSANHDEAIE